LLSRRCCRCCRDPSIRDSDMLANSVTTLTVTCRATRFRVRRESRRADTGPAGTRCSLKASAGPSAASPHRGARDDGPVYPLPPAVTDRCRVLVPHPRPPGCWPGRAGSGESGLSLDTAVQLPAPNTAVFRAGPAIFRAGQALPVPALGRLATARLDLPCRQPERTPAGKPPPGRAAVVLSLSFNWFECCLCVSSSDLAYHGK
jgi:hypothetical protein